MNDGDIRRPVASWEDCNAERDKPTRLRTWSRAAPCWPGPAAALSMPLVARFSPGVRRLAEDKPVRIVVPFAPGGPTDIMARVVAAHLSEKLKGSFIIENKAGAGGNIGMGEVARAEPDGYTLLITSSAIVVNPSLADKVPYDPAKDFEPISEMGTSPNVFAVTNDLGVNTMAELVALAKKEPDKLNYASPGIGTTPQLSAELVEAARGHQDGARVAQRRGARGAGRARGHDAGRLLRAAAGASAHRRRQDEGARRDRAPAAGSTCRTCRRWSRRATRISSPIRCRGSWRRPRRRRASSTCWRRRPSEILKRPDVKERLQKAGFDGAERGARPA